MAISQAICFLKLAKLNETRIRQIEAVGASILEQIIPSGSKLTQVNLNLILKRFKGK
ncbi:MAG: hypothetical protein RMY36_004760 [Nostoc sp. SerVER01]